MRPASDRLLGVVQASHVARSRITLVTGFPQTTTPTGTQLVVIGGDVRMDSSAQVRATLDCTVIAPWGTVLPNGSEVFVEYGVEIEGSRTEWVSLGYFGVETVTQEGVNGALRITGSDRMGRVNRTDNSWDYVAPAGTTLQSLFHDLLYGQATDEEGWFDQYPGVFPPSVSAEDIVYDTWTSETPTLSYDLPIDREYGEILRKVAADHGKRLFFDYKGRLNVVDEAVVATTETSVIVVSSGGAGTPGPIDPPVGQTTNFTEGFASGLSAWNSVQTHTYDDDAADYDLGSADYRLRIVNAGAFHPNALRTEVHDGDTAVGSHERAEISGFGKTPMLAQPGDEKWYEFDVRLGDPDWDPDWDSEDDWIIFFQWHHVGESDDAPPLALSVHNDNKVYFEREANDVIQPFLPVWTVRPGAWEKVIIHVKWSTNPAVGFVHAYVNGTEVVPKTLCQTLHTDDTDDTYPKCGQYRRNTVGGATVVMHDNIRISTLPQTSPTAPATIPPTTTIITTTTNVAAPGISIQDLSRQVTLDGVYNAARVTGEQPVEGDPPWGAAWNNDDYGIGRTGSFGNVTTRFSSPILTDPTSCEAAAVTIRNKVKGLKYSASFTSVPNPALETLDVITLRFPGGGPAGTLPDPGSQAIVEEVHVIDTLGLPLAGGPMQVTTRDGWVTG